ncbi:MAG: thiamine pyrophosphate-dependent enzyme [Deltaproteobacteria bacterium]|nr:thiamine pyrophosphate-dependent enzyme [Deltaproteobacteria bacterium]MCL5277012.1 thiamine pyrophosphate-dependent enzyme [Deltaproteobacteria bacterium]
MAAMAAKHIDFHIMGYYPITPSTEVAENLDEMKAFGEHDIRMIPGDGEHGAAGICYGATLGGGRVFNATSANGFLFSIEQYPVQSGTRFPMLLNLVTRSVSGPLDIKGDHSDLYMALNTGWIILLARSPQAVYDMNIMAVKIGESKDVRLPVIVAYDGFFTSHQKRRVSYFTDKQFVQDFVGKYEPLYTALDPEHPMTFGPYMNDPDLINNKKQLSLAMDAAYARLPEVFRQYAEISGREYHLLETYRMEDAEYALFILNSSYDTAKDAVDNLRKQGTKVGIVSPSVIRPFPYKEVSSVFKHVKGLCVADRADSYGANGGNMTLEIKAALKDDPDNRTRVISRIYGLGGKEFFIEDAEKLLEEAVAAGNGRAVKLFEYHGATPGNPAYGMEKAISSVNRADVTGHVSALVDQQTGRITDVRGVNAQALSMVPKRVVPGHGACPGCGIFSNLNIFFKGIEGDVVVLFHTGCGEVVTSGYPYSSHRITYIHNLFQNGAPTLSGLVEMMEERIKRGELPEDKKITFVMVSGDGGMDIGMGPAIGTALKGHRLILLEYDNEGYMNTGDQLSFSTPLGHDTSTSHAGPYQKGKKTHHKDTAQIMAACHIPYVATVAESNYSDMIKKAKKAQEYAREGFVYVKALSLCPLSWRSEEQIGEKIIAAAVDSCFFPLYEVDHGKTRITYDPEAKGKKVSVMEWLKLMGKTRHLTKPENKDIVDAFQKEVDRRWLRVKAMHESPYL